jgi:hypothetical protein
MRGAPLGTTVNACLVALACHVLVVFIIRKDMEGSWLAIGLGLIGAFFPIIVAVDMGYQAACRERGRQSEEQENPLLPVSNTSAPIRPLLPPEATSTAITTEPDKRIQAGISDPKAHD